jgi:hypothetical protein
MNWSTLRYVFGRQEDQNAEEAGLDLSSPRHDGFAIRRSKYPEARSRPEADLPDRSGYGRNAPGSGRSSRVADRRQTVADDHLIGLDLGGVEEGYAAVRRVPDDLDGVLLAERMAIAGVQATQPELMSETSRSLFQNVRSPPPDPSSA